MRKLSDIHGREAMQLTVMLLDLGKDVAKDKRFSKALHAKVQDQNEMSTAFFDALINRHYDSCVKMLAAIEGISEAEYLETVTPTKMTADLGALMSDGDFYDLFFVSVQSR